MGGPGEGQQRAVGPGERQQLVEGSGERQQLVGGSGERQQRVAGSGERQQRVAGSGERQQLVAGSGERQQLVEGPEGHQAAAELQGPYSFLVLVQRLSRRHRQGIQIESHRPPWSRTWTSALLAPPAAPAYERRQGRQAQVLPTKREG